MITINLLPGELRKQERKFVLPHKAYLAVAVLVLVGLHALFFLVGVSKNVQVMGLKKTWSQVEPRSKDASLVRKEMKDLEAKVESLRNALTRRASMTELLSGLAAAVPKGLWLERFSFSSEEGRLLIQGSVISLAQNEMTIIGKFLQDIRNHKTFGALFSKIDLNSVQRRMIKTYDVVDFVLVGELKK